jgi:Protein of unknown function (DUF2462)
MVQGNLKSKNRGGAQKAKNNSAKSMKATANAKRVKKGSVVKLPKKHFRDQALDDRQLSKVNGSVMLL